MALEVRGIDKRYGDVQACAGVSLSVAPGEVVALLGENGAGKSTLLSVIAGFVEPDAGEVRVDGRPVARGSPRGAIEAGVGTAWQHFSLSPALTVAENLALARVDRDTAARLLPERVPMGSRVAELPVPARQMVEFAKARMLARRYLLLDEPTSLLGGADVDRVLERIRAAAADGVGVVFVTHRLSEALAVADRVVVMRRGWVVDTEARDATGAFTPAVERELLAAMFGDASAGTEPDAPEVTAQPIGGGVRIMGRLGTERQDISLEAGVLRAVAGIAGNGQEALVALLSGERAEVVLLDDGGEVKRMQGRELREWFRREVAVVPADRQGEGGAPSMTVAENLVLRDLAAGRLGRAGLVNRRAVRRRARALIDGWGIRPTNPATRFATLSGGNAQRVMLARALDPLPRVLVAVQPTHGLDHLSVAMVRAEMRRAADAGVAVISIEGDLDEALAHADRIAVLFDGQLSAPVPTGTADRAMLQAMMVRGWAT